MILIKGTFLIKLVSPDMEILPPQLSIISPTQTVRINSILAVLSLDYPRGGGLRASLDKSLWPVLKSILKSRAHLFMQLK